ncbi:MAG: hypothetical protein ABI520_10010 [Caldimonas sp.]
MRIGIVFWGALVVHLVASGAPSSTLSSSETPVAAGTAPHVATYGLCSAPQNAEAFPSSPVADEESQCSNTQTFQATSPNGNYGGGTCGGYTVAFGPLGDFKRKRKYLWLVGKWGDAPLTQANCASARVAVAAWGYRCSNTACTAGAWERIGTANSRKGVWNTTSQTCGLSAQANATLTDYSTVNIDVIATQGSGSTAVRKRAAASIYNEQPNGKCPSATYTPRPPP